jgi:hypothetical protein
MGSVILSLFNHLFSPVFSGDLLIQVAGLFLGQSRLYRRAGHCLSLLPLRQQLINFLGPSGDVLVHDLVYGGFFRGG